MKNQDHPLIKAIKSRGPVVDRPMLELPRTFELRTSDIPELKGKKPGDSVNVALEGKIASLHDDGRVMMSVHGVSNDDESSEPDETESDAKKPIQVSTQESHTG